MLGVGADEMCIFSSQPTLRPVSVLLPYVYVCSARLHFVVARQQQVVSAWHEDTTRRRRLQQLMAAAVQRWGNLSLSRAFVQWRDWALHSASLHRRMRAVISMLMGRTPHWTFAMMR